MYEFFCIHKNSPAKCPSALFGDYDRGNFQIQGYSGNITVTVKKFSLSIREVHKLRKKYLLFSDPPTSILYAAIP